MASVNIVDMYMQGLSIPDINARTGVALSTVRYALVKAGVIRSIAQALKLAADQGKLGVHSIGKKRVFTEEWKQNIAAAQRARAERDSKGFSVKPSGYIEITRGPNKGKGEHIVLMEIKIGRRLAKNEVVHHIDGCRSNNNIDNLQLMTRSEHSALHAAINISKRERRSNGQLK